ncbi:MAG: M48 family metallopeptidase [Pseudomonadota bacterium]
MQYKWASDVLGVIKRKPLVRACFLVAAAVACASLDQAFMPSDAQVQQQALSAWSGIKQQERVTNDPRYVTRVQRVATRVISAAGQNPAEWEVQVFASDQLNAFALPGNKIGFYTGILDLMDNDDQIAAVMGHEVVHVLNRHAQQRVARATSTNLGIGLAGAAIGARGGDANAWTQIFGMGAQIGNTLPFSRNHELEADREGLRLMVRANYDPRAAVTFWRKMRSQSGSRQPEFLSTHPDSGRRIQQLETEISAIESGA